MNDQISSVAEINRHTSEEEIDSTVEAALDILAQSPDDTLAIRYLARLYSNRKEVDQAEPYWAKLAVLTPNSPEPFLQLARIQRQREDWVGCQLQAERCLSLKPHHAEALTIHLQSSLRLKAAEKIRPIFARLCKVDPDICTDIARRAANLSMTAEIAESLQELAQSGKLEARELCQSLAQAERDAAIGFEIQRNPFSAAQCYRTMRILETEKTTFAATSLARLRKPYLERARKSYQAGDDAKAFDHCLNCIRIEPQEAEPYIIAGRSLSRAGDEKRAFSYFSKGVQNALPDAWLHINYGRSAERLGRSADAYDGFLRARLTNSDKAQKHSEEIERSLARLPARMMREAQDTVERGEFIRAIELALRIRDDEIVGPEGVKTLCQRVLMHAQRRLRAVYDAGDDEALVLAQSLSKFMPEEDYALRVAGRLLLRGRRFDEAVTYWKTLADRDPEKVEYRLNIARCYHRSKDRENTQIALHKLLTLDPDNEEGAFMLDALAIVDSNANPNAS